jgi:predicted short-subunit dehydrogenase-like oxidoreductase (DUF2520 family)
MKTFSIIGAGRLGTALAAALVRRGWKLRLVVDRDPRAARESRRVIGSGRATAAIGRAARPGDVVIIAVPDAAVGRVAASLAASGQDWAGRTVLHTSGILPAGALGPLRERGARTASLHPVQSIPRKDTPASAFRGILWGIEGDEAALLTAQAIVRGLGGHVLRLSEKEKPLYHAACALASNALVALAEASFDLLRVAGIDEKTALAALLPLMQGTLQNVKYLGPQAALTGPVSRGDGATVQKHLAALRGDAGSLAVYRALGKQALGMAARRGLAAARVRTLRRLLEDR